jgi:hypothetical protein
MRGFLDYPTESNPIVIWLSSPRDPCWYWLQSIYPGFGTQSAGFYAASTSFSQWGMDTTYRARLIVVQVKQKVETMSALAHEVCHAFQGFHGRVSPATVADRQDNLPRLLDCYNWGRLVEAAYNHDEVTLDLNQEERDIVMQFRVVFLW